MPVLVFKRFSGFTLIELLIVVAIIAILAAIAVPNFLEAQVRAKVSRAKADMRTVATGLEMYALQKGDYPPNDGLYNVLPIQITTPVAFLTSSNLIDPFVNVKNDPVYGELARFYTYTKPVTLDELMRIASEGGPLPPVEGVDAPGFNEGAFERWGRWRLASVGPDQEYLVEGAPAGPWNPNPNVEKGCDIPYDPTNGTVSPGNIFRTQKYGDGIGKADI